MNYGPTPPHEDDGGMTDAELDDNGWAYGLGVWGPVTKSYSNDLADGTLANSQLWSLRQAIRAEVFDELGHPGLAEDQL